MSRPIPGSVEVPGRQFLYLESESAESFEEVFPRIVTWGDAPLPRSGGAINEAASLRLPSGTVLQGVSFKGDLEGWRRKIVSFAEDQGLLWAEIKHGQLVLSNGQHHQLSQCTVEFSAS